MHTIRRGEATDLPAVIEIDGNVERTALLRRGLETGRCLVAELDSLVGFVLTTPRGFFGRDFVELVVVRAGARRRGLGRALVRAAVAASQTDRMFSSTNESNEPMRMLFLAEGWTFSGRLDGLDEGDLELVFYVDVRASQP
jgi:GNAT superfamily N-acetyltransferase